MIDADEFLSHNTRDVVNAENRTLDYHVPFLGTDKEEYVLVFDQDVVLENAAELTQSVDNEYANYEFKVTQMKPNMIRIQSSYEVKKIFIPKADVKKLYDWARSIIISESEDSLSEELNSRSALEIYYEGYTQ